MSNCFNCNVDFITPNLTDKRILRGGSYVYFNQGLESVVSVVEYPNQDSAHDNSYTNNYVTYRINGFHYKGFITSDSYVPNDDNIYIVFFKVKVLDDVTLNITQLKNQGDFSDFILYKQPNDVIDYRYFRLHENHSNNARFTRETNVFCNKTFFVKPDDVFGVYYLQLSRDGNTRLFIRANISVYFDVV